MNDGEDTNKVQDLNANKQGGGNPLDKAMNKLREGLQKEHQTKIEEQVKKTVSAVKAATHEKKVLAELLDEYETDKSEFKSVIDDLKDIEA